MKIFAVLGTTNDITTCEHCGRTDLKHTIVLDALDADGNRTGDISYYGATCGARAAGWTTAAEFRKAAKTADTAAREAKQARDDADTAAFCARRDAWITANVGADAQDNPHKYGFSNVRLAHHYMEMTGDKA